MIKQHFVWFGNRLVNVEHIIMFQRLDELSIQLELSVSEDIVTEIYPTEKDADLRMDMLESCVNGIITPETVQ